MSRDRAGVPKLVWSLGWVSLLTDFSSEMIYPLLPVFLVGSLGVDAAVIGFIEGLVEASSSILKKFFGQISDRYPHKKGFVLFGYSLSSFAKPLMAIASSWPFVLAIRLADRVGKGVRSAPRDVMIANACTPDQFSRAYGVHRAMDHMGAVIGPVVASLLIEYYSLPLTTVFALSAIPAVLTVFILSVLVKEKNTPIIESKKTQETTKLNGSAALAPNVKKFLLALGVFTIGNSTDAFLILKLNDCHVGVGNIALIWAAHHLVKVIANYYFGKHSDRIGNLTMIRLGWLFYFFVYLAFAYTTSTTAIVVIFLIYGLYYGLCEPSEKSFLVKLTSQEHRGAVLGWMHMITGLGVLPASLIFGVIWKFSGPHMAFLFGSVMAILALVITFQIGFKNEN